MTYKIENLLNKNKWFENPTFISGPPKSGTTLLMNLLDGHDELITMPFEPAFPEMLYFKKYFKNTTQIYWDWVLNTPYLLHLTQEQAKHNQIEIIKAIDIISNDVKISRTLIKKLSKEKELNLKKDIGIDFPVLNYLDDFKKLIDLYKRKDEKEFIFLNLISLKKNTLYKNKKIKGRIFKAPSLHPFDTRAIDNFMKLFTRGKIIIITRDSRGFFLSLRKQIYDKKRNQEGFKSSIWSYFRELNILEETYNELMTNKILKKPNFISIKYEELVLHPKKTINYLCKFLEVKFNNIFLLPTTFKKSVHVITANSKKKNIIFKDSLDK